MNGSHEDFQEQLSAEAREGRTGRARRLVKILGGAESAL